MKRFNLLSAVIAVVLMVTAVSCTTMRETEDDYYYDRAPRASNRVYVDDPYRGTVVLERDPYTGRYYEVGSYGGYSSTYGYRNDRYGTVYDRNYRRNRTYSNQNGNYNRNNTYNNNTSQGQTEDQKKEQRREEARKKVLGN